MLLSQNLLKFFLNQLSFHVWYQIPVFEDQIKKFFCGDESEKDKIWGPPYGSSEKRNAEKTAPPLLLNTSWIFPTIQNACHWEFLLGHAFYADNSSRVGNHRWWCGPTFEISTYWVGSLGSKIVARVSKWLRTFGPEILGSRDPWILRPLNTEISGFWDPWIMIPETLAFWDPWILRSLDPMILGS